MPKSSIQISIPRDLSCCKVAEALSKSRMSMLSVTSSFSNRGSSPV